MRLIRPNTNRGWRRFLMIVLTAAALPLVALFSWEVGTQAFLQPAVERRIGAQIQSPHVVCDGVTREVISFENVRAGACAGAGVTSGDIVVSNESIGQLCRLLNGRTGKQVTIEVVNGGDGPPIEQRTKRQVTITLP
jgi:hypothetical protein